MKERLNRVKMDYHTLLISRSESERKLIKRIFKEAGCYKTYINDVIKLKKQQIL